MDHHVRAQGRTRARTRSSSSSSRHDCGNLFGDEKGTGIVREDIKDAAFNKRASDRLLHMDEVDQEIFDGYVSVRAGARSR